MLTANRRYDIDWLRVISIGLLLIYHIAIVFQPWGVFYGFIQNDTSLESLWIPLTMINIWRIPLLFFVSGMGVCFAIKKRNWKELVIERTQRILIPFLFGIAFIVPIHVFFWQNYYKQEIVYAISEGHLWFLKNIFLYVIILSPVFFYLKRKENSFVAIWIKKLFSTPLGFLLVIIIFALEAALLNPEIYELYALSWHGFFLGLFAFLFGFIFVLSDTFWHATMKWRWIFLILALSFYLTRYLVFELRSANYLMAVESLMWIFSLFGFSFKYLNHPSAVLHYLSQGAYPIYIIHMLFLYLGSILILPLDMAATLKFIFLIFFTGCGSFAFYETIRRVHFIRPLFGLKPSSNKGFVKFNIFKKMM